MSQATEVADLQEATGRDLAYLLPSTGSPALQMLLDERLFNRAKQITGYMAKANGMIPRHLIGQPEACFAVLCRALTWKLDPFAVALATYQTPAGSIGFFGSLCQAILENSGKIEGPIRFKHYGEWELVQGKYEIKTGKSGKPYAHPSWDNKTIEGKKIGVTVIAKVKNEVDEREMEFDLIQAFPRNSTLWATDPKTQICYTAVRRFANVCAPGLFFGLPFDYEETSHLGFEHAKDVTPPRPTRVGSYDPATGEYVASDGSGVPDGKPLREHYVEKEQERREAQEREQAQAMAGQMPDTSEERGEAPPESEERKPDTDKHTHTEQQQTSEQPTQPSDASAGQAPQQLPLEAPDPAKQPELYRDWFTAALARCAGPIAVDKLEQQEFHQLGRLPGELEKYCVDLAQARRSSFG